MEHFALSLSFYHTLCNEQICVSAAASAAGNPGSAVTEEPTENARSNLPGWFLPCSCDDDDDVLRGKKKKKKELKYLGMRDGSLEVFIMEPRCNLVPCAVVAGRTRWCSSMPRDTSLSPSATWSMLMSTSGKWAPMNSNCTVNNFPHEWFVIIAMREQAIKL